MSTDSSSTFIEPVPENTNAAANVAPEFANSAHPPLHLLNAALTPKEFKSVFRANHAEVVVYEIVFNAQKPNDEWPALQENVLTLFRKQADGRRQVGVRFRALGTAHEGWLSDAPDDRDFIVGKAPNNQEVLQALAIAP